MTQSGPNMTQKGPKWPKNDPKWPKNDPHFFRNFLTEKAVPQTFSLLECMEQTCQFNEKIDIFQLKYEFDVEFDIPVTYPMTSPEIALPELDGKTAKVRNVSTWLGIPRSNSFS